jgi:hypothetical protein
MAVIDALAFATAAGFAVVVATTLVIIGARQEERRQSLIRASRPTIPALLARRVLGAYVRQFQPDMPASQRSGRLPERQRPPWPP